MKLLLVGLIIGALLVAAGFSLGRLDNHLAVRDANQSQRIAEASADSLARFISGRKCWFDPVPRSLWNGKTHQ